jgi:hypothetical protein
MKLKGDIVYGLTIPKSPQCKGAMSFVKFVLYPKGGSRISEHGTGIVGATHRRKSKVPAEVTPLLK